MAFFFIGWALMTAIATAIGASKGRTGTGLVLGLILGIFGVIIIACVPKTQEKKIQEAQQNQYILTEAQRRQSEVGFGRDLSR